MFWFVVALLLGVATAVGVLYVRKRAKRPGVVVVSADLAKRIEAATRAFAKAAPWQPASVSDAPESAAAIEAALIAREPRRALELAERRWWRRAAKPAPSSAAWLAWVLCE
jgi:hypothetical protein